ncbi:unnamed protein product [Penicillium pancosmium]
MDGAQVKRLDLLIDNPLIGGLIVDLQKDNKATFHFLEGEVDSDAGPGISSYYDGPYYSYYRFPRTFSLEDADETDILDAYELLYETISFHGPFDGVLGFSHGGTLAAGFLIHHAKQQRAGILPPEAPLFRCAIFVNSLPPFHMNPGHHPVIDEDLDGYITIPCVHKIHFSTALWPYIEFATHVLQHSWCMGKVMMSPQIRET